MADRFDMMDLQIFAMGASESGLDLMAASSLIPRIDVMFKRRRYWIAFQHWIRSVRVLTLPRWQCLRQILSRFPRSFSFFDGIMFLDIFIEGKFKSFFQAHLRPKSQCLVSLSAIFPSEP